VKEKPVVSALKFESPRMSHCGLVFVSFLLAASACGQALPLSTYSAQRAHETSPEGSVSKEGSVFSSVQSHDGLAPTTNMHANSRRVAKSLMSVDAEWDSSTYTTAEIGGLWSQSAYTGWAFNKEFNATNTDAYGGSPASALMSIAYANGTAKDTVALMTVALAGAAQSSLFGLNAIATSTGNTSAIFRGGEIDIAPATTDTVLPGSAGLYFNAFNKPITGAVIQSNGLNGGKFANGFACGGVVGTCLFPTNGSSSVSLVDASQGTFSAAAFVTGAGRSKGFEWGNMGIGTSPVSYGDASNNFVLQLGRSGAMQVKNSAGTKTVFQVAQDGVVSASTALQLPKSTASSLSSCDATREGYLAAVTDAKTSTFNAEIVGGGSNHVMAYCNGSAWTVH
jgi:hypothetical protein